MLTELDPSNPTSKTSVGKLKISIYSTGSSKDMRSGGNRNFWDLQLGRLESSSLISPFQRGAIAHFQAWDRSDIYSLKKK